MTRRVWAAVLGLRRECPFREPKFEAEAMQAAYEAYSRATRTRLPGIDNDEGLEAEGRGISLWREKWARAIAQWDDKVAEEAAKPRPNGPAPEAASGAKASTAIETNAAPPPPIAATPFRWIEPATIPPRRFVYGRHYIRQFVSTTVAPGGVGKSSLGIAEALAMTSGKALLGVQPKGRSRVWLWNGEDPLEELQRRVMATALHYGLTPEDLDGLYLDSGRLMPIIIAKQAREGAVIATPIVEAVTATIRENGIDVVSIDPFVSSHRVTENDNNAIETVAKTWAGIADETKAAIDLVHHTRKTGGAEATVEDGRGASALLSAARSARVLNQMAAAEAGKAGVENPKLYFRIDNGKANLTPPVAAADWYKLVSVDLGNGPKGNLGIEAGDNIGVVTAWTFPNAFDGVTVAHLRAAQQAVAAGGPWRENNQAKDWVGKPIAKALKLDPDDKAVKQRVGTLLKTWTANSSFVRVMVYDPQLRKNKPCIEVGQWAND
jgi:hypothetical protein